MGFAALAEVMSGWTGSIAVTYGGTTTTIVPRTRESVASILARLIHDVLVDSGLVLAVSVIASDQLRLTASDVFALTCTGLCGSRIDFDSGPYSGAATYDSDANGYEGRYVPTGGIAIDGDELTATTGRAVSSGSFANRGATDAARVTLTVYTVFADAWTAEVDVVGVYDVWLEGRVLGRVRIDGWSRTRRGKRHDQVAIAADALAVSE